MVYEFIVNRKIMRITGDSATGKTALIDKIEESAYLNSGVHVECKYPYEVMDDRFFKMIKEDILAICEKIEKHSSKAFVDAMRNLLHRHDNILFFADESFSSIASEEFALFCKYTDAFFVLVTRDPLYMLPYSYTELYEIKTSGKFHQFVPCYNQESFLTIDLDRKVIVEDKLAGFEFFKQFCENSYSADGKSNIRSLLKVDNLQIVADGAAFGCEIENIILDIERCGLNIKLFLPESFEYLLLDSELFKGIVKEEELDPKSVSGLYFLVNSTIQN